MAPRIPVALAVFWPFQSLARLWLVGSAGDVGFPGAVGVLLAGFLRDGLLVASLWLPLQILGIAFGERTDRGRAGRIAAWGVCGVLALVLAALFGDAEFVRYVGAHPTLAHLALVGDGAGIRSSVVHSLAPLAVAMGLAPVAYLVALTQLPLAGIGRLLSGVRGVAISLCLIAAGLCASQIPLPDAVAPAVAENVWVALVRSAFGGDALHRGRDGVLPELLDAAPLSDPRVAPLDWTFFDPAYPLVKATDHHRCRLGLLEDATCQRDEDGDGTPLARDCNDREAAIHPGAWDVPRNGIDEDCSGLDAEPPNVIFLHWEGVRAVNVGRLGYATPATPRFDRISEGGRLFGNTYANGTQTRWSLISIYCSTLPRLSERWIFKHDPDLNLLCLPEILKRRGYHNLYVHGGLIGFAGKGPRMQRWFETRFDRLTEPIRSMPQFNWGARDRDVLDFALEMLRSRDDPRPFFLALPTLAVHHPFGLPEPGFADGPHGDRRHQIANVIRYSDDALADFLEELLGDPRFENTLVLVASDHGVNWFAPHPEGRQSVLWEDLVWVPLALLGDAWNVEPGIDFQIRQLADIAPTVLDRLGIEIPNPFLGHSLLRRFEDRDSRAFFATANGGRSAGVRIGPTKFWEHLDSSRQWLFDLETDRPERSNRALAADQAETLAALSRLVRDVYGMNERLIDENRVWNPAYELDGEARR